MLLCCLFVCFVFVMVFLFVFGFLGFRFGLCLFLGLVSCVVCVLIVRLLLFDLLVLVCGVINWLLCMFVGLLVAFGVCSFVVIIY